MQRMTRATMTKWAAVKTNVDAVDVLRSTHSIFFFFFSFYFTSAETIRLIRDGEPYDGHLDFYTAPELLQLFEDSLSLSLSARVDHNLNQDILLRLFISVSPFSSRRQLHQIKQKRH